MKNAVLVLISFLISCFCYAENDWQEIAIPGAKCGDVRQYSVLLQKKVDSKLLVEFMGGGVCWDYNSCFKRVSLFPWLHGYPVIPSYSIFTANKSKRNLFKDFSKIYFPYCTADVHAGNHVSNYNNRTLYHIGRSNIYTALNYLKDKKIVSFDKVNDLVVYGASAGGIASLLYGKDLEQLTNNPAKKTMIVDSPGLHFGQTFWNKFDSNMKRDFKTAFNHVDLDIDFSEGKVAKKMQPVLENYNTWRIGFIYGLRDMVMSKTFGNISPEEHRKLLLSNEGLPYIAKDFDNVFFWLRDTSMHTFLLSKYTADLRSLKSEDVNQFVKKVYER
jgi:hypothetical protein